MMVLKVKYGLLAISLLLINHIDTAQAKDSRPIVQWLSSDLPPLSIASGDYAGQGYGDRVYEILAQKLTEYRHRRESVTLGHSHNGIAHYKNACAYEFIKTPQRMEYMIFSKPLFSVLPNGVVTFSDKNIKPFLNDQGQFVITRLKNHPTFFLGIVSYRSYGERLDKTIADIGQTPNGLVSSSTSMVSGLYNMMKLKRLDASLGYAAEALFITLSDRKVNPEVKSLVYYPIKDHSQLIYGHVACHNGEFGQEVVKVVNERFNQEDYNSIKLAYMRWLGQNAQDTYLKALAK